MSNSYLWFLTIPLGKSHQLRKIVSSSCHSYPSVYRKGLSQIRMLGKALTVAAVLKGWHGWLHFKFLTPSMYGIKTGISWWRSMNNWNIYDTNPQKKVLAKLLPMIKD